MYRAAARGRPDDQHAGTWPGGPHPDQMRSRQESAQPRDLRMPGYRHRQFLAVQHQRAARECREGLGPWQRHIDLLKQTVTHLADRNGGRIAFRWRSEDGGTAGEQQRTARGGVRARHQGRGASGGSGRTRGQRQPAQAPGQDDVIGLVGTMDCRDRRFEWFLRRLESID